ncbi:GNAT family N-acetyltransferase [Bernardetia sp.]|uniref:GNAT family N-acetyltransferase n=1 Tax=Bernardetia sp. TaxID=1937974 RepID=UPI0025C6A25D|nr:GNAT family N-acetyltransferase [Bernardetia sp.]
MHIQLFTGDAIQPYIRNLAALRMEVFREYPYLYDGDFDYEQVYLYSYIHAKHAAVVLAFDGSDVIGASTCIALDESDTFIQFPFLAKGYDVSKGVYFEESVLRKKYRKQGIGVCFFEEREKWAATYFKKKNVVEGRFTTFCGINRPKDHPLRPKTYANLEAFWNHRGYIKQPNLQTQISWKEIDQEKEEFHNLTFWIKNWEDNI